MVSVGHKQGLKKEERSLYSQTSVLFVKLSSGTSSSQPVLFDFRDYDPDESPTVELEALLPKMFMYLSDYIISLNFSPV
jgi:hypothetical protein